MTAEFLVIDGEGRDVLRQVVIISGPGGATVATMEQLEEFAGVRDFGWFVGGMPSLSMSLDCDLGRMFRDLEFAARGAGHGDPAAYPGAHMNNPVVSAGKGWNGKSPRKQRCRIGGYKGVRK